MVDGLLGKKISMTQIFDESGEVIPATVIEAGPCPIVQIKTEDREGYNAVQLGFGAKNEKKLNQPKQGHFKKAGVDSQRHLREFQVANLEGLVVGATVDAGLFAEGDLVDITGTSKGRGFTGVVKRWGFKGGRASHGDELAGPPYAGQLLRRFVGGESGSGVYARWARLPPALHAPAAIAASAALRWGRAGAPPNLPVSQRG